MDSLANNFSLHVGYYEGRVKIFPFSKSLLLDKSFFTFTFTTVVFTEVKVGKKGVVQQRGRLGTHKEEERAFKVSKASKVFKVSHTACQGEDEGNEED